MKLDIRLALGLFISMVLIQGAGSLEIGGGSSASIGAESIAAGWLVADGTGSVAVMSSAGTASYLGEVRYVQDSTGKRAEMSYNVTNPEGTVGYSAKFTPSEGTLGRPVTSVSATQNVLVAKADRIELHAAANSSGSDVASVDLNVTSVGSSLARFSGSTTSTATAGSATAKIQGQVVGSVNGNASYGGCVTRVRDSLGQKIEGSLAMMAICRNGTGDIGGISRFSVREGEKIGAAIDASWDGDIINVARGSYNENLVMDKDLTLIGAGPSNTVVDGQMNGSVITIGGSSKVTLSGMTLQNGSASNGGGICNYGTATAAKIAIYGNSAESGGGIYSIGTATVASSTISGNSARYGGGIYCTGTATVAASTILGNSARYGGGIYAAGKSTITNSAISKNSATDGDGIINEDMAASDGGGIYSTGTSTIDKCIISGNSATGKGGGIYSTGTSTITTSTISENSAGYGGGINVGSGTATVSSSTVSKNLAVYGGGIYSKGITAVAGCIVSENAANYNGGGINVGSGTTTVSRSIISGNSAMKYGGGIINFYGITNVTGSTISKNHATYGGGICSFKSTDVVGSIVSSNSAVQSGGGIYNSGALRLSGASLLADSTAMYGYGGGLYSTGDVTFNGTKVLVMINRAYMPASAGDWYQGYGVYSIGMPSIEGGFNPAKQMIENKKA